MDNKIKEKLKSFKWRYIDKVPGSNLYYVKDAKDFKVQRITVIDNDRIAFYHENCDDHACVIYLKDILLY